MRKSLLFVFAMILSVSLFAQTQGAAEKNAGNAAVKAKNYAEAFKQYQNYLKIVDFQDKPVVFNAAYCASKIKNYALSEKYYRMSIDNKYKAGAAYLGLAKDFQLQKNDAKMIEVLQEAMKDRPTDTKLATMYASHFLKLGQNFQKANNVAQAVANYNKVVEMQNKQYKAMGYLSIATLYFNDGAKAIDEANKIVASDKAKSDELRAKGKATIEKAKENIIQAKATDPMNKEVTALLAQIMAALK